MPLPASRLHYVQSYWLTRFVLLRLLGVIYAVAFLVAINQLPALIGEQGLTPVGIYLDRIRAFAGSSGAGCLHAPSLFWLIHSDAALLTLSWVGFGLSLLVVAGFANAPLLGALWVIYLSIVHVGQDWYSYGWEIQLLETGFLAIFLAPLLDPRPFGKGPPPRQIVWLFLWLVFRIMLGAGLIKLRGDAGWRDLSILTHYFETQPIPGPLSRWFHFLPTRVLEVGVLFNFLAELGAPVLAMWPHRRVRIVGGTIIIVFQLTIILSGNLSFLNWLTIVPALACFDDHFWARVLPSILVRRAQHAAAGAAPSVVHQRVAWGVTGLVAVLSIQPALNLISAGQIMNTSFDPLELVNTYGAFGSVGQRRYNVVFEGTNAGTPRAPDEDWQPYPYKGLPVDERHRPPQIAPYQLHLDWQMWFASMSDPQEYPWTLHLVWKLLHNDPGAVGLFATNPFPGKPPRYVRAVMYEYKFAPPGNATGAWWTRTRLGLWLPPLKTDDPSFQDLLREAGWLPPATP